MGLFDKLKNIIKEKDEKIVEKYDEGLTKTRDEFVNKLNLLGIKYTKIDDKFYEELEEILIMADLGVNTTMEFVDKLKGVLEMKR